MSLMESNEKSNTKSEFVKCICSFNKCRNPMKKNIDFKKGLFQYFV